MLALRSLTRDLGTLPAILFFVGFFFRKLILITSSLSLTNEHEKLISLKWGQQLACVDVGVCVMAC